MTRWTGRVQVLGAVVAMAVVVRFLLSRQLVGGHDAQQYLVGLVELDRCLRAGHLDWAPDLAGGLGEPLFLFTPVLPFVLAWLFLLGGMAATEAWNAALAVLLGAGAAGMYAWVKVLARGRAATLAAAAWVTAPWVCVDLHVRGAFAEFSALALAPWLMWALEDALRGQAAVARAAVVVALLAATHHPSLVMLVPAGVLYAAFHGGGAGAWRKLAVVAGSVGGGLLLGAWSWWPAWRLRALVHADRLLAGYNDFRHHSIDPAQWWELSFTAGLSLPGPLDGMSQGVGPVFATVVVACVATGVFKNEDAPWWRTLRALAACAAGALFMSTAAAWWLWEHVSPWRYLQFGMRWLGPATLFAVPLLAVVAERAMSAARVQASAFLPTVGWFVAWGLAVLPTAMTLSIPGRVEGPMADVTPGRVRNERMAPNSKDEFLPRAAWSPPVGPHALGTVGHGARVDEQAPGPWRTTGRVTVATESADVVFPHLAFPGWEVRVDGQDAASSPQPVTGLLRTTVTRGTHAVEARWVGTRERHGAVGVSLLALVAGAWLRAARAARRIRR